MQLGVSRGEKEHVYVFICHHNLFYWCRALVPVDYYIESAGPFLGGQGQQARKDPCGWTAASEGIYESMGLIYLSNLQNRIRTGLYMMRAHRVEGRVRSTPASRRTRNTEYTDWCLRCPRPMVTVRLLQQE